MIQDIELNLSKFQHVEVFPHNWDTLLHIFKKHPISGITFDKVIDGISLYWRIGENLEEFQFKMLRNCNTKQRLTIADDLGMVGFSSIDITDKKCILVEGVSDFITTKLITGKNVLGMTTLSGNKYSKEFIASVFDELLIIGDNDYKSERNTGLLNSQAMREFYTKLGKKVRVQIPDVGYKDITAQFINQLKFNEQANN